MQYYGTLYFGTPPQPFTTVFSTEQAWTWLNDVSCGEKCHPAVHAFNSSESSTFEGTTESKEVESGSKGQGTALLAFETVRLSPKRGVVAGQAFLLMQESAGLTALSADGYTVSYTQGLAFSKLSEWHDTFLGSLKKQGLISQAQFAFYLSNSTSPNAAQSSLSFGSYDLDKYALGNFSYIPVDSEAGLWNVPLQSLSYGRNPVENDREAVVSSGASFISISTAAYKKVQTVICQLVQCDTHYSDIVFDCGKGEESVLPEMVFRLGGQDFPLGQKYYIGRDDAKCYTLLVPTESSRDVLGYPFLRAYYTLFDAENYRIGLAPARPIPLKHKNAPVPSNSGYIWLGLGVFAVISVLLAVWCLYSPKKTEQTTSLMEPLVRNNDD